MAKKLVTCGQCAHFIKPPVTNRIQPGLCRTYEEGRKKANQKATYKAYMARGNCPFLDCTRRICAVFEEKSHD